MPFSKTAAKRPNEFNEKINNKKLKAPVNNDTPEGLSILSEMPEEVLIKHLNEKTEKQLTRLNHSFGRCIELVEEKIEIEQKKIADYQNTINLLEQKIKNLRKEAETQEKQTNKSNKQYSSYDGLMFWVGLDKNKIDQLTLMESQVKANKKQLKTSEDMIKNLEARKQLYVETLKILNPILDKKRLDEEKEDKSSFTPSF
ncbi:MULTISPECIES: hypothetical protein [unclassified Legionella]|uniref:hypothetical protein n=1 Tax=unclassified Legionella TaxID=2622702 RepID=UPI001055CF29|nr:MULTISPECIES: hypothetical protein [unclassified Legionella]MDI9819302.1 hypothetical protein [Legionella sp. PL877]